MRAGKQMADQLPFGETEVDIEQFGELMDLPEARSVLSDAGVPQPQQRLDRFVERLPSLLDWLSVYGRDYPWRYTADPWRVYLTEILLQRTRAGTVAELYDTFFERFPDPEALYRADQSEIFELIEPLGFGNQRTRTLREVAELVVEEHDGEVPASIDELQRPFRTGPYSARACLQFAFGEPMALVDANFARVIGRVFDYEMPEQPHKSEEVYALMEALVPEEPAIARAFNLALLDLGALVCTPTAPACEKCPLEPACAYASAHR